MGERWRLMCDYRLRIADEADRLNMIGPPPRPEVWDETTRIGERLGFVGQFFAMCLPRRVAQRGLR